MRIEVSRAGNTERGGFGCGIALLTGAVALLLVSLAALIAFLIGSGHDNAAASFLRAQPGSVRWDERTPLTALILTTDPHSRATESLVVASYVPATNSVRLLALPPNLWVTVPGFGQNQLSQAYSYGGTRLALLTVQGVLHVPVPYSVQVNSSTLRRLIDSFGGVDLHLHQRLNVVSSPDATMHPLIVHYNAGRRHLDGTAAVQYARREGPPTSAVMHRQHDVLAALVHRMLSPSGLLQLPVTLNMLGTDIETNFPFDQLTSLTRRLTTVRSTHVSTAYIGASSGTAAQYTESGLPVLLPDWQQTARLAQQLFHDDALSHGPPVTVLNGTGISGQAADLATWLHQATVRVRGFDSAPSYSVAQTQVVLTPNASAEARYVASRIASLLQVPIVTGTVHNSRSVVTVIIGQDYESPLQQ